MCRSPNAHRAPEPTVHRPYQTSTTAATNSPTRTRSFALAFGVVKQRSAHSHPRPTGPAPLNIQCTHVRRRTPLSTTPSTNDRAARLRTTAHVGSIIAESSILHVYIKVPLGPSPLLCFYCIFLTATLIPPFFSLIAIPLLFPKLYEKERQTSWPNNLSLSL